MSFEPQNNEDFVNKFYLYTELSKAEGHISFIEKTDNEFKLHSDKKQSDDKFFWITVKWPHRGLMMRKCLIFMIIGMNY